MWVLVCVYCDLYTVTGLFPVFVTKKQTEDGATKTFIRVYGKFLDYILLNLLKPETRFINNCNDIHKIYIVI